MSSIERKQDLGDLFSQRRSAAAKQKQHQQQQQQQQQQVESQVATNKKSTLLDIQAEQERERYSARDAVRRGEDPPLRHRNSRSPNRRTFESSNNNYNSSSNNNNNKSIQSGGHRRVNSGRGGGRPSNRGSSDHLPVEQGVICSLKESFGFIHCADRPEEMFFHYSELVGCRSDDLNMDDEVEFRVQSRNDDKIAALQVRVLDKGSIVWEIEDEPGVRRKGVVERPARSDQRGFVSNSSEGTIRLLVEEPTTEKTLGEGTASSAASSADAPSIRFRNNEYQLDKDDTEKTQGNWGAGASSASAQRLSKGDLVEFSIVTERRTKLKYARAITLLQSERERARKAREEELLAAALPEQGVVTSLKTDFGFLRSNRRREPVYFHYSNVIMSEESHDFILKEGQDVAFLAVVESSGEDGQKRRVSAREVEVLPRGSVVFSDILAMGVTGTVTRCPQPVDAGHHDEVLGTIQLSEPLHDKDDEGSELIVSEVGLSSKDSPGGDFSYRSGAAVGLWIREGDTLLFDVAKDFADGTYRAAPTKHLEPLASLANKEGDESVDTEGISQLPAIRLVGLSLVSRAEGIVHAIKDNYGFIHYAERIVDVHFRMFEVLPDELQADLRRNMGFSSSSKQLRLDVGTEVQFDLSLHGKVSGAGARGRNKPQERENLKAQRLLMVPSGTVVYDKVLATGVKGVVTKEDPKQPHAGTIDLDQEIQPMTMEERYPIVAKMIETFLGNSQPALVYPDLLSLKESGVITEMALTMGKGLLEIIFIPFAADLSHPGRLCIRKKKLADASSDHRDAVVEEKGDETATLSEKAIPVTNSDRVKSTPNKKKSQSKIQVVKTVRYDKHSLTEELKEGMPPCEGDVVVCDVIQSRKNGQVSITNVTIIERKTGEIFETEFAKKTGLGIVKEVAQSRQYGFISVFDETATKPELLFFHMSDSKHTSEGDNGIERMVQRHQILRKGDEVKFNFGKEKNGKRVAKNVETIPKGTIPSIPSRVEKNACRGYILMVPSRTSLASAPLRHSGSNSSATGGSRWDNVKDDSSKSSTVPNAAELGSILLLEDPSNVFAVSGITNSRKEDVATPTDSPADSTSGGCSNEVANATKNSVKHTKSDLVSSVGARISYTNGAIAAHGQGSHGETLSASPRRGDMVSFLKSKNGNGARDVRVVTRAAATLVKGRLEQVVRPQPNSNQHGTAKFIVSDAVNEVAYDVDLTEVVSCSPSVLKENESVEGVLHDGKIYGICRNSDIHLESKLGSSHKERPKLNLTVRKDRGGTIMAQSMMAKGPDGTDGFVKGWTQRISLLTSADFSGLIAHRVQLPEHS